MAAVLLAVLPSRSAAADSDRVLLIYRSKEEMRVVSDLIAACGKQVDALSVSAYEKDVLQKYDYIVLQDSAPLPDALETGKQIACIGDAFTSLPGIVIGWTEGAVRAQLSVYDNAEQVVVETGTAYIRQTSGAAIGSISFFGEAYPLCAETDAVLYAPYLRGDDLSAFAAGQMLNRYFGQRDGGSMYVLLDEIYPFEDLELLRLTAEKLYESGIPFIVSVMPVYYNTEYPSFQRYANVLRYIQSVGGSIIMHEALETGNELVGDPLEVRLEQAYQTFLDNGIRIYDEVITPYSISLEALSAILPQNELFISLPIDTVLRFDLPKSEAELDAMIDALNEKWLQIGDYGRYSAGDGYYDDQRAVDADFQYRETTEQSYAFLVDKGNQVLFVIVIVSMLIVLALIAFGYRLYWKKFLHKKDVRQAQAQAAAESPRPNEPKIRRNEDEL